MRVPFVVYPVFESFTEKVKPDPVAAPVDRVVEMLRNIVYRFAQKLRENVESTLRRL